jgi:SAM-dependent methyltransferase
MSARAWPSDLVSGTYEQLADEYYDPRLHPTCANFREASALALAPWLRIAIEQSTVVAEVGAGRSLAAEEFTVRHLSLSNLFLLDSSRKMLAHSSTWGDRGARLIISDAKRLPFAPETFDLVVASLGDPYNGLEFWRAAHRVLKPGGHVAFTTPSYEWAVAFRGRSAGANELDHAQFTLANGSRLAVPSSILPERQQRELIERAGFVVDQIAGIHLEAISATPISPKLLASSADPVLRAYCVTKTGSGETVRRPWAKPT